MAIGSLFLAWTIIFVTFQIKFSQYKLKYDLARAELDTKVGGRLADTIANNTNLKLFAGLDREAKSFSELTGKHHGARYKSWTVGEISDSIQGFSMRILEVGTLFLAVHYWRTSTLTLGDFLLIYSYLQKIGDQVQQTGHAVRRIYEAMADANEMTEILLTPHEITDDPAASALDISRSQISFWNVDFSYPGNPRRILEKFHLEITPGEKIGIVGPSGGGKSTVLKLLTRMYDVSSGIIGIDGQNIASVTQDSLHRNIAFVPQDPILFHRSLMENIRYSRASATDEEVIHAARLAHCHEFISGFPQSYETLVGERGVKLSGGERQRVAIARAILMNAPILVMDEATSSLDSESEMYIQDALATLMQGRTVLVVAHRLSTIHKMDRIIVLEDGQITEQGDHDLLLKIDGGTYNKLWNLQSMTQATTC